MVKKKLYLPALVLALVIALTVFVGAYDFNYVVDDAELLTADEKADVEAYYDRIYTEDNLLLVFVTAYGKGDVLSALPDYAGGAVDAGGATDMLLLYVDMDARHFDLYQYNGVSGESAFRVNSSETDTILDAVLNYAADGDWYGAALCFADEGLPAFTNDANFVSGEDHYGSEGYQEYKKPDGPVTWQYKLELIGGIAAGVLPIALLISLIVTLIVLASYKKKVRGAIYPLEAFTNVKMTASQDNFINKTLTVTTIHRDNDSGGSSGGSSGGGGGGGGGGGHMGGRSF